MTDIAPHSFDVFRGQEAEEADSPPQGRRHRHNLLDSQPARQALDVSTSRRPSLLLDNSWQEKGPIRQDGRRGDVKPDGQHDEEDNGKAEEPATPEALGRRLATVESAFREELAALEARTERRIEAMLGALSKMLTGSI